MMTRIKQKMTSDTAAMGTVETIILIALSVFAALALFTFILKPVQENSADLGAGVDSGIQDILNSDGRGTPSFNGSGKGDVN